MTDENCYQRVNQSYNDKAGDSPQQRKFKTNIPMQVEFFLRIIPPFHVKDFFQNESRKQFKK